MKKIIISNRSYKRTHSVTEDQSQQTRIEEQKKKRGKLRLKVTHRPAVQNKRGAALPDLLDI